MENRVSSHEETIRVLVQYHQLNLFQVCWVLHGNWLYARMVTCCMVGRSFQRTVGWSNERVGRLTKNTPPPSDQSLGYVAGESLVCNGGLYRDKTKRSTYNNPSITNQCIAQVDLNDKLAVELLFAFECGRPDTPSDSRQREELLMNQRKDIMAEVSCSRIRAQGREGSSYTLNMLPISCRMPCAGIQI